MHGSDMTGDHQSSFYTTLKQFSISLSISQLVCAAFVADKQSCAKCNNISVQYSNIKTSIL